MAKDICSYLNGFTCELTQGNCVGFEVEREFHEGTYIAEKYTNRCPVRNVPEELLFNLRNYLVREARTTPRGKD